MQRKSLDALKKLNEHRFDVVGDPEIATRINSFEMAYRMQTSAPELMDLGKESKETLEMYGAEPGKSSFANNCLLARRLVAAFRDRGHPDLFQQCAIIRMASRWCNCRLTSG